MNVQGPVQLCLQGSSFCLRLVPLPNGVLHLASQAAGIPNSQLTGIISSGSTALSSSHLGLQGSHISPH